MGDRIRFRGVVARVAMRLSFDRRDYERVWRKSGVNCGPAALAMLANYYGHPVSQDEIAGAIYLPDIGGTLTSELGD